MKTKKTKCWLCKGTGRENKSKDIIGGACFNCHGTGYEDPNKLPNTWGQVNINTLENPLDKLGMHSDNTGQVTIADKIKEYLEVKDIGQCIIDGCDLILRLRMGQPDVANSIITKYIKSNKKSKYSIFRNPKFAPVLRYLCDEIKKQPLNIDEPLYKAIELGNYIKCYKANRMCKDVKGCWITRRGLAKCNEKEISK